MLESKTDRYITMGVIVITFLLSMYFSKVLWQNQAIESQKLVESLGDELEVWKDKDSINHAKIRTIETRELKNFLKLETTDSLILDLQKTVKTFEKRLKKKGSVTNIYTSTDVKDTSETEVTQKDTIGKYIYPEYKSNINLKGWVTGFVVANKDSTLVNINVKNKYSAVIGQDKQGWFKKPIPFVEVLSENPYTEIKGVRTYKVSLPREKKIVIGPGVSIGLDGVIRPTINATYGIIKF